MMRESKIYPSGTAVCFLTTAAIALALAAMALTIASAPALAAQAGGTTFPAAAWNGMQVTYTIQGATIGTPSDSEVGAMARYGDGALTSRTLRVYGTWKLGDAGDGETYQGAVDIFYHKNGDIKTPYTHLNTTLKQGSGGEVAAFDVQVDVPDDAPYFTLEINETSYKDKVTDHNLYVQLTLQNPYYGKGTASAAPTATGTGPTSVAGTATAKAGGLAFGTPIVALSALLGCGFVAVRAMRKKD